MYFDDDKKGRKQVNLGNKNISNKEEFLKKMKEEKNKEVERIKIQESYSIISKFLKNG